jgi:two-component system chemotaxis response regulator CheB
MPPTFNTLLAEHLERVAQCPVHEGRDGEPVKAGCIYIAPGGRHMKVARRDTGTAVIEIDDGPRAVQRSTPGRMVLIGE